LKDKSLNKLVLAGLLAAFIFILTVVVPIRIPGTNGGYINLGDAGVFTAAYLLGWPWGAMAAAVGSALADMVLGSVIYAGPTFLIKGCMALLASYLLKRWKKHALALLCAGLVMPLGYFLFEAVLYGPAAALVSVPMNLIQYAVGVVLGLVLIRLTGRLRRDDVR